MTKLHHTEYKKNYKNYILSTIEEDGEGKAITTESKKIDYIFDRFNSEYGRFMGLKSLIWYHLPYNSASSSNTSISYHLNYSYVLAY